MERFPSLLIPPNIQPGRNQANDKSDNPLNILSQTIPADGVHRKAPKGHSEAGFEGALWRYFPGKIHTGLIVKRPDHLNPYIPDFAYIDPQFNLHIDIEVDEPYAYDTRCPLHYLDHPKDYTRNQFFLSRGWVVIRFSEEQVVRSPLSCCKAIAGAIATILGDSSIMNPFRQVPTLKPQKRWTEAEAQQMAETGYREQYLVNSSTVLPSEISQKLESKSNLSGKRRRRKQSAIAPSPLITSKLTFYCPECGEGPIRWQGHYVSCPTCSYDAFVL